MCSEPIADEHQHVVNVEGRQLMCVCRGCFLLFTDTHAELRYRAVPDRYLELDMAAWNDIRAADTRVDTLADDTEALLGPGHVSTVVGLRPYRFVPEVYGKPMVVAGFEPLDILASVHMLLQQIRDGRCEVENQYTRVVRPEGNTQALKLMAETFELRPHFEWRGLGFISQSALKVHTDYADYDAEVKFDMPGVRVADPKACQCGEVLKGVFKPWECKVFGTACTPETPIGTCMVSPEGACAAYYNFGRLHRETAQLLIRA
jgi:hydrogenase expression/formation protein HypD